MSTKITCNAILFLAVAALLLVPDVSEAQRGGRGGGRGGRAYGGYGNHAYGYVNGYGHGYWLGGIWYPGYWSGGVWYGGDPGYDIAPVDGQPYYPPPPPSPAMTNLRPRWAPSSSCVCPTRPPRSGLTTC